MNTFIECIDAPLKYIQKRPLRFSNSRLRTSASEVPCLNPILPLSQHTHTKIPLSHYSSSKARKALSFQLTLIRHYFYTPVFSSHLFPKCRGRMFWEMKWHASNYIEFPIAGYIQRTDFDLLGELQNRSKNQEGNWKKQLLKSTPVWDFMIMLYANACVSMCFIGMALYSELPVRFNQAKHILCFASVH